MSSAVFVAILCSSFMQASWNFWTKKSKSNKTVLLIVGWMIFGVLFTPVALYFEDLSQMTATSWSFVLLSGFIHFVYVLLLGRAYTQADISVVYPVARGGGVAITSFFSLGMGWVQFSALGFTGAMMVVLGTLLIAYRELKKAESLKGFAAALCVACAISTYSIVDSIAASHVPILFFVGTMNLLTAIFAAPLLLTKYKTDTINILKTQKLSAFFIAFMGSTAYLIILWAYKHAQVSYVVTIREFSIVVASILGFVFLKEKIYFNKVIGILFILSGVLLVKIS